MATTTSGARTSPCVVWTAPSPKRTAGERSYRSTPASSTARRSARTSRAGRPGPCKLERTVATEERDELGKRRPVAVDEAAVASARTRPTLLGLDENDAQRRLALLQSQGCPEAGEAAADDADVRLDGSVEQRG